ncbi:MAG: PQQ-dependent sugar dehydrogenase [Sphingobacteriales bacterium]|nr:MAG: PQQ-dependent sugar dehydrogenase [Sphingobacteriales bacterium]
MKLLLTFVGSLFLMSAACTKKDAPVQTPDAAGNYPPVETESPNSAYQPAFAGQTRAPGVKTSAALDAQVISKALNKPWGIVTLPDGRLLITEKEGTLRIAKPDGTLSAAITGITHVNSAGQGGLLDVVPDPDFTANRMIYWTFSENVSPGNLTAVGKGRLSNDETRIENPQVIYRAIPVYDGDKHFGGRIVFDRSGNLFVSTGERSDLETRPKAQQLDAALGKILHLTKDGQPVSGNPFIGQANALPQIYTYGHRNPQSLAIHPETGDLWEAEMGPRGGDEVNRIIAGKNYGWPTITYGIEYSGAKVGEGITQKAGLEQPVYYWDPVVSVSGMIFYSGKAIPEWKNNLLIGCLSGQHIARLVLQDNKVVGEERLLATEGERFRDLAEGTDGAVYAVTDGGKLYRIALK